MSQRFAVVYEAEADFLTATELADRVLVEAINDWLDAEQLPYQREWISATPDGEQLAWSAFKNLARQAGVRAHGHFGGQPGFPDATAARRAIAVIVKTIPALDAILLIRDQDDQPERRNGLEQARTHDNSGLVLVISLAIVERECWVLSGFDPLDEDETTRLESERQTLGFDPRARSHDLTACKDDTAARSPKRVLQRLATYHERQRRCWCECSLEVLRTRGQDNGLADYLREVRERLAPLIGHVPDE